MLSRIECSNYRVLEDFGMDLTPLTVLVGANGSGKSTVLRAINFLLGERWPAQSQLDLPGDFTRLDNTRSMRLRAHFDPPLTYADAMDKDHAVGIIEFVCQPYVRRTGEKMPGDLRDIFRPLAPDGSDITVCIRRPQKGQQPAFQPLTSVGGGLRDQARVLTITESRTVGSQLPGRRGSVLARLLAEARGSFLRDAEGERTAFDAQYATAVEALRTTAVKDVEAAIQDTARRMLGFKGSSAEDQLEIEFGFADPGNPHSALRLICRQGSLVLPADAMGLGEQSAIVVGLFEAFRQRGTSLNTIAIEEPEMYLHPQAQRYFKRLLTEIVDDGKAQVIMTTHSTIFADLCRFREVRLMASREGKSQVALVDDAEDRAFLDDQLAREKLTQYVDSQTAEMLFATGVLLVEGHGDRLATAEVASKLGLDLDAEGLSVIACGGKNALPFFARLCRALDIRFVIMHDADIYEGDDLPEWAKRENERAPAANTLVLTAAGGDASRLFILAPTLEHLLGVGRGAADKPQAVLAATRAASLDALPELLVSAVRALAALVAASPTEPA
jgi:putative ATP-dependent endonuclease of OLD family